MTILLDKYDSHNYIFSPHGDNPKWARKVHKTIGIARKIINGKQPS